MRRFALLAGLCVLGTLLVCAPATARPRLFGDPYPDARRAPVAVEPEPDEEQGEDDGEQREDEEERDDRRFRLPPPRRIQAQGAPAAGFFPRAGAITIAWATAPLRFTRDDWKTAGMFLAVPLALIVSGSDEGTTRMFTGSRSSTKDRIANAGDSLGEVPVALGILSAFGLYGHAFGDARATHTFEAGLIATALSGGVTTALKYASGRARPSLAAGLSSRQFEPFGGDMSFPSGHAAVAFSLAGTIGYHYPGWVGRTAMLGACFTGFARVYNFHHWTSDVVFAAMLSTATAHCVSRMNLAAAHGDLTFEPYFGPNAQGLALRKRF